MFANNGLLSVLTNIEHLLRKKSGEGKGSKCLDKIVGTVFAKIQSKMKYYLVGPAGKKQEHSYLSQVTGVGLT